MLLHRSVLAQQLRQFCSQSTEQQAPQQTPSLQERSSDGAKQLTAQQQQELAAAVLSSFKASSKGSCKVLLKHLNEDAKRELLAALEHAHEQQQQHLSRVAMANALHDNAPETAEELPKAIVPTTPVIPAADLPAPTRGQLLRVALTKGIPFVAFGFFDNMIMITAGEQIDLMFGAKLGLSSMMAAGLGNTVADVVGINISHTIEQKFKHMQSMAPQLTKAQMKLPQARRATWLGCAVGMATGCLLGLTPLLFFETEQKQHKHSSSSTDSSGSSSSSGQQPQAAAAAAGPG